MDDFRDLFIYRLTLLSGSNPVLMLPEHKPKQEQVSYGR